MSHSPPGPGHGPIRRHQPAYNSHTWAPYNAAVRGRGRGRPTPVHSNRVLVNSNKTDVVTVTTPAPAIEQEDAKNSASEPLSTASEPLTSPLLTTATPTPTKVSQTTAMRSYPTKVPNEVKVSTTHKPKVQQHVIRHEGLEYHVTDSGRTLERVTRTYVPLS